MPKMTIIVTTREGEIHPRNISDAWSTLQCMLTSELRKYDPAIHEHHLHLERGAVRAGDHLPVDGYENANLLMTIVAPGNDKLAANVETIVDSIQLMLRGWLSPAQGIFARLVVA